MLNAGMLEIGWTFSCQRAYTDMPLRQSWTLNSQLPNF